VCEYRHRVDIILYFCYLNEHYKGYLVYAWCKESSLPLLIEKGFNGGESCIYVEKKIE
jgi:hypothetical protein